MVSEGVSDDPILHNEKHCFSIAHGIYEAFCNKDKTGSKEDL
jgi:hypothetical protein